MMSIPSSFGTSTAVALVFSCLMLTNMPDQAVSAFAPATIIGTAVTTTTTTTELYTASFNNNDEEDEENPLTSSHLPGNFGFDPLHCAQTKQQLITYRQAEMKHARLAILAVVAFAWSDLNMVDTLGATPFFEGRTFPQFLGACVGLPAALELYGEKIEEDHSLMIRNNNKDTNPAAAAAVDDISDIYFPGNLELDPFHLYPAQTQGQRRVQFAEIMAGRVCMVAAAGRLTQFFLTALSDAAAVQDDSFLSSIILPSVQSTAEAVKDIVV